MSTAQMFTVFDIALAIFRSPIRFLIWFLFFFTLVVLTYLVLPREYKSDGKLFVQVGRSSVGAAPTTSAGKVSLQDSRETEIKSVVGLLESRELADRVADRVGIEKILKPHSAIGRFIENLPKMELGGSGISGETELTSDEIDAINRHNEAIEELMDSIEIENQKNTTVISVGYEAQTPFLAQEVVEAYLDEYQKTHVKVNTPQSGSFFTKQLKRHKTELLAAEQKVAAFRSELDVLDVTSARSLLQKEIDQLKLDALVTKIGLSESTEKLSRIKRDFATVPSFITGADKKTSSLARDKAREALYNMQLEESELSAKYRGSNPRLIAIRESIAKAKTQLSKIPKTFQEAQRDINPARAEILVMLTHATAEANGFQKRLEATETLIAEKMSEVDNLNSLAIEESGLKRDVDILRKTMLTMADKTAESVTLDALDSERISNVTIAQAASLVPKKVFPSGLTFGAIGLALSALLATIMTFLKEFRLGYQIDRRNQQLRRNTQQIQQSEERPVRRLSREPAMAGTTAGAVGDQYDYQGGGYEYQDEGGSSSFSSSQRPLHQELQDERDDESQSDLADAAQKRMATWKQRSEKQVSVLMLVGGFTVLIAAYFLIAAFR